MMIRLLLVAGAILFSPVTAHGATIIVNSGADAGGICPGATCTLRQAILAAASGDTINFAAGITTINLTSGELSIDKDLTISGPGPNLLTVERSTAPGTLEFHIFHVEFEVIATISGLAILNGSTPPDTIGGAIFNGGVLTVNACTISGNLSSGDGGAIFNDGGDPGAALTITNSTISGNSALGDFGGGGGILDGGGHVTITNSTVSGNSADNGDGGGIWTSGVMTITNSTISGNSADNGDGGGIWTDGETRFTNSTISGNSAGNGGGILNIGIVHLTRSTVSGNTAAAVNASGGGIANEGARVDATNTIIALNTAAIGPDVTNVLTSIGFNLIGNNSDSTIESAPNDLIGTEASPIDPMLGPLQDNGGATRTQALLFNSPAIDKGGNSFGSTTDQRGFSRPVDIPAIPNATGGDSSDIGAFEFGSTIPTTLSNISTRLRVETGDNALIAGFIITGTQPKKVIVRAIGPSLSFADRLADPILELHDSFGALLETNDNWMDSPNKQAIIDSTIPPTNDLESAIVQTLPPAAFTAIVRGMNDGTGIGIVEVYDLDAAAGSKLANISTRGFVQTGDNVLIAGTIVVGQASQTVIVRALGPSLSVPGKITDPTLELRDNNGALLEANDNWVDSSNKQAIIDSTIPPTNDFESAIVRTLPPAAYTAIVRGVGGATGIAVVEVYALN